MFKKVLVLADGDDPHHPALQRAMALVADDGEIEIFSVAHEPMLDAYLGNKEVYEPLRRRVLAEREERVAHLVRAVESEGVRCRARVVWVHPLYEAVAAEAVAQHCDLVVVAIAKSHSGRGGASLTHSDWQIVARCSVPVLVVSSDGRVKYRHIVAAVDPFHSHAKPANLDSEILRYAKIVAARVAGAVSVVHCYPPGNYLGAELAHVPALAGRSIAAREQSLNTLCVEAGVSTTNARVALEDPPVVLRALQARGEADLIVMGVLARSRLKEFILGNTAERVLHGSVGDVLLVKPVSVQPTHVP